MANKNDVEFVWESTLAGKSIYGEYGNRDVIILVSRASLTGPDIVHRATGELTQQDKDRLVSEGITEEAWDDEVDLMIERYKKEDSRFEIKLVIRNTDTMTVEHIIDKIKAVLDNSNKPGVTIHYFGPGKRNRGDWCFKDGFLTFMQITELYKNNFKGKVLEITSDCSYSGSWVQECMEFLDNEGIQPCGHSAKSKKIMLKISTSCGSGEVGSTMLMTAKGRGNDKNSGVLTVWYDGYELADNQHISRLDSTCIKCKKLPDEQCILSPNYTWYNKSAASRVYLVRGKDRERPAWHYVLVVDDQDTIKKFKEATASGKLDVADYGQVLESGWGKDPPNEVKEKIDRTYNGSV